MSVSRWWLTKLSGQGRHRRYCGCLILTEIGQLRKSCRVPSLYQVRGLAAEWRSFARNVEEIPSPIAAGRALRGYRRRYLLRRADHNSSRSLLSQREAFPLIFHPVAMVERCSPGYLSLEALESTDVAAVRRTGRPWTAESQTSQRAFIHRRSGVCYRFSRS